MKAGERLKALFKKPSIPKVRITLDDIVREAPANAATLRVPGWDEAPPLGTEWPGIATVDDRDQSEP